MTDSTDFLKQRLHILRGTMRFLLKKADAAGGQLRLDPIDHHSLRHTREGITACKAELRQVGVPVDDLPEDAAPAAPDRTLAGGMFQLRAPVADFVGRDAEVERLVQALRPGQSGRAAAISGVRGMGGLGKTELAYAAAARLAGDYPDGQILLELAGASPTPLSSAQALQQVIRAFRPEEQLPEEVPALQPFYRSALAGRKVLILADDARDAAQVRPLLAPAGCALLVTSRQRFALDGMTALDLERLEEGAAVKLLCGICARLSEEQAQQIARLCGHLPLALRVSSGILLNDVALSPERYLARLKAQPLAELRDPDDPAHDVGALLRLSYATLDAPAQAVFRRLGVLVADADLSLIATLLELSEDQTDEVLRSLLRRSLVEYDEVRQRWGMHDLVRACGLGLLIEAGEERAMRLRYAERVIGLIEQADRRYHAGGDGVLERLSLFDRERAHLETVRVWLWAQPPAVDIDRLVIQEAGAAAFIGLLRDPVRTVRVPQLERALAVAQRRGDRVAEGHFLGNLGIAYRNLGELRRAIDFHEQNLAIARELGDRRGEGRALGNLGLAYTDLGELRRAIDFHERHLAIARELGDRAGEGITLGNLGLAYRNLGELRRAIELYEQDLAITRELGDRAGEGITLINLGSAYADLGDLTQALCCSDKALHLLRTVGDRVNESEVLNHIGYTHFQQGQHDEALAQSVAALDLARDTGNRQVEGMALRTTAVAHSALKQSAEADANFAASLAILEAIEHDSELARTRWAYGQFLVQHGDRERGLALLDACVAYEQQIGHAQAAEHAALVEQLRADGAQPG